MISAFLCFMGALFGVFALTKWFSILKPDVHTGIYNVIPIAVTTIAWLSSAVTFYQIAKHDSPIDIERFFMVIDILRFFIVIGAAGLIWRIKVYRESSHKKDALIKELRETINQLTAK